ncbi:flagellar basal body-associated protein FliL [Thiomicrorhabdus sp. Milos-T2]|uniref:flagellar basal body-associated FliL family protein n=1 Tax=Thiomicrorhabdus sp. Milos-T2 TaxID=90814 RepID=UPI000494AECC|nr:flagellar basal body-associated FliL family protein [Thiomicrorhabdus sp. Milos-T2]
MSEEEVKEEKKSGGGKGLIIVLLVVVILLLVGIGVMAFLLLSGDKHADEKGADTEVHASAEHGDGNGDGHGEEGHDSGHAKEYSPKYKQFEPPAPEAPPTYFTMDKFVVNFYGDGQAKFLAVDLKFLSYYPQIVGEEGEMEHLRPILKNDIERLLRNQHYNELDKPDGPDKLRAEILEVTRKVLEKHNIYPDLLEDVYMTRFVMQ